MFQISKVSYQIQSKSSPFNLSHLIFHYSPLSYTGNMAHSSLSFSFLLIISVIGFLITLFKTITPSPTHYLPCFFYSTTWHLIYYVLVRTVKLPKPLQNTDSTSSGPKTVSPRRADWQKAALHHVNKRRGSPTSQEGPQRKNIQL